MDLEFDLMTVKPTETLTSKQSKYRHWNIWRKQCTIIPF